MTTQQATKPTSAADEKQVTPLSPLSKQVSITVVYLIAIAITVTFSAVSVTSVPAIILSAVGMVIGFVAAFMVWLNESHWHLSLIAGVINTLAFAALQYGTGGLDSVFAACCMAMLVGIAFDAGRRHIVLTAISAVLAVADTVFVIFARGKVLPAETERLRDGVSFSVLGLLMITLVIMLVRQSQLQHVRSERALAVSRQHSEDLARSEARAREMERLFRGLWGAITEQSAIGTDVSGLIDAWNPGAVKMFDLNNDEVVGKRHIDDFHLQGELSERASELNLPVADSAQSPGFGTLVETARRGNSDVREWTYLRADGAQIPVELSITTRVDDAGKTIGYLFVAVDLRKAKEVSRLKDEFVGLISHELRTPLSSILGYLELLRDEADAPLSEEQLGYLNVAERNANRLLRLVGDLLFTAQVEAGKFQLDKRKQPIGMILAGCVESGRPVAARAGIKLVLSVEDDCDASVDAVRLGQACDNLISNAIKFTPSGGTVTVGLTGTETAAVITVTDTGMGIAADELDKLFSRFFRATTATRNAVPGVGLGLVITRAIARAHGGDMSVTSEEGVGTCFSMTLPLLEREWLPLEAPLGARP
jgi:signal transduction histidine kinase